MSGNKITRKILFAAITAIGICLVSMRLTHIEISVNNSVESYEKINTPQIRYRTKQIALTFDDGPSSQYTEKLLDGLKERGVKATFFIMGKNIEGNEKIIERIYKEGHLIGNHTFSHINLKKAQSDKAEEEIKKTNKKIFDITGYEVQYIRPPFGAYNEKIKNETDMSVVLWNVDPLDWKDQNQMLVKSRVIKSVKNGDIILLHDIFKSSVDAALDIVDKLMEEGYRFVRVDELVSSDKIK